MELVGLVRVSTEKQETARQHDALDSICVRVFEEKISGKLAMDQRPGLREALDYMREDDMLAVQEVDRLGRSLMEGLLVLTDLFERTSASKCWRESLRANTPNDHSYSTSPLLWPRTATATSHARPRTAWKQRRSAARSAVGPAAWMRTSDALSSRDMKRTRSPCARSPEPSRSPLGRCIV